MLLKRSSSLLKLAVPVVQLRPVPELTCRSDGDIFDTEVNAEDRAVLVVAIVSCSQNGTFDLEFRRKFFDTGAKRVWEPRSRVYVQ